MRPEPARDEFDPSQLMSDASLNRTTLAAIDGADAGWVGRRAFELLSLEALKRLCAEHGFADGPQALDAVATALSEAGGFAPPAGLGKSVATARAREVCAEYGRRLAHLVASLITPGASVAWSPWRAAYLDYWSSIDHIWLGGGIAAILGDELARTVRAELARFGARACDVAIAPHPSALAVIGAARTSRGAHSYKVALDFGHSMVKRGVAIARHGSLERLELLPRLGSPSIDADPAPELVRNFVLDTIADTCRAVQQRYPDVDPHIVASLATYLTNGMPVDVHSLYRPLSGFTIAWVEGELEQRIGHIVQLTFLHDGTAAARAVPAGGRAAVIMLGTAMGVGFRPLSDAEMWPLAPDLVVTAFFGG